MTDSPENKPPVQEADVVGKRTLYVAAFLMALPALVPALVIVAPGLVPFVGEVDTSDTGMVAFLIGMSVVLLIVNEAFLFMVYRWINKMARDEY